MNFHARLTADASKAQSEIRETGAEAKKLGKELESVTDDGREAAAVLDTLEAEGRALQTTLEGAGTGAGVLDAALTGTITGGREASAALDGLENGARKLQPELRGAGSEADRLGGELGGAATAGRKTVTVFDAIKSAAQGASTRLRETFSATDKLGKGQELAAGSVANLTAQFNDIGMMLMAGQNPLQLAVQQGTAITQVIGPMGATGAVRALGRAFVSMLSPVNIVTIGAIAAGAAITQWLTSSKEEAESFEEVLDRIEGSLKSFREIADRSVIDLAREFGSAGGEVRQLQSELQALSLDGLLLEAAELGDLLSEQMSLRELRALFGEDTRQFSRTGRDAGYNALRDDIGAIGEADDIDAQIAAIRTLQDTLKDAAGGIGNLTKEQREFYLASLRALETLERIREATSSSAAEDVARSRIYGPYQSSREEADAARSEAEQLLQSYAGQNALLAIRNQHGEQSAEYAAALAAEERRVLDAQLETMPIAASLKDEIREAFRNGQALADAPISSAIQDAAEEAARLARNLDSALSNAQAMGEAAGYDTERARIDFELRDDPVARARALAALDFDRRTRLPEGLAPEDAARAEAEIAAQREAFISARVAAEGYRQERLEALKAEGAGSKSGDPVSRLKTAQDMLDAQAQSIAQLRLEQTLLGQSEETRRRVLALYQAELEIRRQGLDTQGALAEQIRDGALEQSDLAANVARQADAWGEVQRSAESAIDGMLDAALDADIPGVFEAMATEITAILQDLAIRNPLKNALLGSELPTLDDAGGLQGIWDRLTGKTPVLDPMQAAAQAAAQSVATMQVTAANVVISGAGVASFAAAGIGAPANLGGAGTVGDWLSYANQGATRNQPISAQMQQALSFLGEMGVRMEVFSGGQDSTGPNRLGSHRHDGGNAADALFYKDGRQLDWANPADRPIFEEIVSRARGNGLTGFGAGPGYMRAGSMHLGYGAPAVWGSDLTGGTAPDWLRQAWQNPVATPVQDPLQAMQQPLRQAAQNITALAGASDTAGGALGTLGTGFDAFGQLLAGLGGGAANSNGGGALWAVASAVAGSIGIPGFEVGGPTGGSDPKKVAGLVHEREFVFDAAATARIGVANLEAIRQGRMPGYAKGGYVSPAAGYAFLSEGSQASSQPQGSLIDRVVVNDYAGERIEMEETTAPNGQRQLSFTIGDQMARAMSQPGNAANKALKHRGVRQGVTRR